MEYEKLYLKTFNEVHSNTENYIKTKLIESINNDYGFNEASKEILEENEIKFQTNKFNTTPPYTDLIYIFNKRIKYSKNINENALKRDVKPMFDNLNIKGYSFEDLIKDLAEYFSETNTYRIFRNHYILFDLIYKSEDFSRFEIKEYDTVIENTEIFNYYRGLIYPQEKIKNKVDHKTIPIINSIEKSEQIKLSEKEIALLIHLQIKLLKDKNNVPKTEIYKSYSLINVRSIDSFENNKSYKGTYAYHILSANYDSISLNKINEASDRNIEAIIGDLMELSNKIKPLKMINFNKEITNLINKLKAYMKRD